MLFWDKQLKSVIPTLEKMDQTQRFAVAMTSLGDVRSIFDHSVRPMASHAAYRFFVAAFKLLSSVCTTSEISRAAAQQHLDAAAWVESAPPGVWDMGVALLLLLKRGGSTLSADDVLEIMSAAYQVILHVDVISKLAEEVAESELALLERGSKACVACINGQLRRVTEISGDQLARGKEPS